MASDGGTLNDGIPSKKKRRGRCGKCGPCHIKDDCGQCKFCQNKQVLKQSCILRKCIYLRSRPPMRGDDCSVSATGGSREDDDLDERRPLSVGGGGPPSPFASGPSGNLATHGVRQRRRSSYGAGDRGRGGGGGDDSSSSPLDLLDGTSPKSSLSSPVSSYDEYITDAAGHGHHPHQRKHSVGSDHYPAVQASVGQQSAMHYESKGIFSPGPYALHQQQLQQQQLHLQQQQQHLQERAAVTASTQHHLPLPQLCGNNNLSASSAAALFLTVGGSPLFTGMQRPPPSLWPLNAAAACLNSNGTGSWRGGVVDPSGSHHRQQPSPQIGGPLLSAFQQPTPSPGQYANWSQQLMPSPFANGLDPFGGTIARCPVGTFRPPPHPGCGGINNASFGATERCFLSVRDYIGTVGRQGVTENSIDVMTLQGHNGRGTPLTRDILGTAVAQSGIPDNSSLCRDTNEDLLADCCGGGSDSLLLQPELCDNVGGTDSSCGGNDIQISLPSRGMTVEHMGQFCDDDLTKLSGLAPEWLQMNAFDPVFPLQM